MTIQRLKKIALAGIIGLAGLLNGCENSATYYHQAKERSKYDVIPTVRGAPVSDYIGFVQLNSQGEWEYTDKAIENSKLKQLTGTIKKSLSLPHPKGCGLCGTFGCSRNDRTLKCAVFVKFLDIIKEEDEKNPFQSRPRFTSFYLMTDEGKTNALTARYRDAEKIKTLLDEGDRVTIRYKYAVELNNLDGSNIIEIEKRNK